MQMTADEQEAVDSLVGIGKDGSQNNESYTVEHLHSRKVWGGEESYRWYVGKVLEIDDEQEEVYI